METYEARALTADWLNAWLAAIGVTVLVPEARLRWTGSVSPYAVFESERPIVEGIVARLPTPDVLAAHATARKHADSAHEFTQNPTLEAYIDRARIARVNSDWTLAIYATDLAPTRTHAVQLSPFNVGAPRGITLFERLAECVRRVTANGTRERIERALRVGGGRERLNGLAFDARRVLAPTVPNTDVYTDPAVEVLAFFGLMLIPVRGDGRQTRARGWSESATRRGAFRWPAWTQSIDISAIDALLDAFWSADGSLRGGVSHVFQTVPYRPRGQSDPTRGYASELVTRS